jgi:hypothetical protein
MKYEDRLLEKRNEVVGAMGQAASDYASTDDVEHQQQFKIYKYSVAIIDEFLSDILVNKDEAVDKLESIIYNFDQGHITAYEAMGGVKKVLEEKLK